MLVTALLCKDEASKDLRRVLLSAQSYSDTVLVLDDGSTDGSVEIARACGAVVRVRSTTGMWGNEAPARRELWEWGAEVAGDGWLLIQDCDMLLDGDPRPYTLSRHCNAWSFILYDLWDSETTFRCDGYWQGHTVPRPWLFRPAMVPPGWTAQWPERGIHTGHCPMNFPLLPGYAADLSWRHYAYLTPERRMYKYEAYRSKRSQLSPFEAAHAESILG